MLNPHYRYIALDFETTGLDIHSDEPIQIGIVEIDVQGKFLGGYQSLLAPQKSSKQLKSIVGFITGLSLEQLVSAPSPSEILGDIEQFFGERTIIIGHNIGFDLEFLKKFFPSLTWYAQIDTFKLSQDLLHYVPSYAQEILIQQLLAKPEFPQLLKEMGLGGDLNFHDAFMDAKFSLTLFLYLIKRCGFLFESYPILHALLAKSEGILSTILNFSENGAYLLDSNNGGDLGLDPKNAKAAQPFLSSLELSLPPLKKISPTHTQLLRGDYPFNLSDFEDKKSFHIANLSLKSLLSSLATHKHLMLSFSTKAKLDIAKNILNDLGIKNIGFAKQDQTLNPQSLQKFVSKSNFTESEFSFLLKYFSHHQQGLGVLDLNSKENFEIYTALRDQRATIEYPIVLTTHGGLFSLLEDESRYADYQVVFFDASWRYKSFNLYLSRPYDPNYTLNYLDMLYYKYSLEAQYGNVSLEQLGQLEQFREFFTIFIGILGQETKKFFTNTDATTLTLPPIVGDVAFYQTNKLLARFPEYQQKIQNLLQENEFSTLRRQIQHMQKIFASMLVVEKKMYERSAFSFVYAEEVKFSNRNEFCSLFAKHKTLFLSNLANDFPALLPQIQDDAPTILMQKIFHLSKTPSVLKALASFAQTRGEDGRSNLNGMFSKDGKQNGSLTANKDDSLTFILSVKKEESRLLFEELIQKGFDKDHMLLVENITGGSGKNLFKAKQAGHKIVIGGYNFLLQLFAQKLAISQLIVYNSKGQQQDLIFNDIVRYGRENLI